MSGVTSKPYDGEYTARYGQPSNLYMKVTVNSDAETIGILFKCGQSSTPYNHIFKLESDDEPSDLILKDYIDNTSVYRNMLNEFRRRCPQFGNRAPIKPDLGWFTIREGSPRSLKVEISGVDVKLLKNSALEKIELFDVDV